MSNACLWRNRATDGRHKISPLLGGKCPWIEEHHVVNNSLSWPARGPRLSPLSSTDIFSLLFRVKSLKFFSQGIAKNLAVTDKWQHLKGKCGYRVDKYVCGSSSGQSPLGPLWVTAMEYWIGREYCGNFYSRGSRRTVVTSLYKKIKLKKKANRLSGSLAYFLITIT